ncbi:MAG TPA: GGDEF domain-containing protein, partial [Rubrivivax sp.]|nr:GGDEF domain-containing protein [Rubrivivax sp.]
MSFWHTELRGEAIDNAVNPALRVLLDRWRQAAPEDPSGLPSLGAFAPEDMPLFSPHLMLLQAEDDDFRYRHYGSEIHRHTGRSPEGTLLSSIDTPLARFALHNYLDVLRSASPMYTVHVSQDARSVLTWERLILPLRGPDRTVWILVYGRPLEMREQLLDAVLNATTDAILALRQVQGPTDEPPLWLVALGNPALHRICGLDPERPVDGKLLAEALPPAWYEVIEPVANGLCSASAAALDIETTLQQDGQARHFGLRGTSIPGGCLIRVADLTTMRQHEAALRRLANEDGLTGIANRRAFDEALQAEARRATRAGVGLALVILDIDHFKRFNDQHGHAVGDQCLQQVARVLASGYRRPGDLAARIGGEEF